MSLLMIVVLVYPAILVGMSVWRSRSIKSHADFIDRKSRV